VIPSWFRDGPAVEKVANFINTFLLGFIVVLTRTRVIHAHDRISAYYAIRLKEALGFKVVYDIHGINIEEQIYSERLKENSRRHKHLNEIEQSVVKSADFVFCVSERMKDYVRNKYDAEPSKFVVTPTSVDTDVFAYSSEIKEMRRKELGLNGKFVVLFMGHSSGWQIISAYFGLFKVIKNKIRNVHFLVLTNGISIFEKGLKEFNIPEECYSIYSVKHNEVPHYAVSADMAVLLRDSSVVNQVAAPAKFAEYLALGLPVLVTKGIGDTESIIKKYNVGVALEDLNSDEMERRINEMVNLIKNHRPKLSEDCVRVANNLLSKDICIERFMDVYEACQPPNH
jgi:glycosyltransferase involved in cell wall biosynthesis